MTVPTLQATETTPTLCNREIYEAKEFTEIKRTP